VLSAICLCTSNLAYGVEKLDWIWICKKLCMYICICMLATCVYMYLVLRKMHGCLLRLGSVVVYVLHVGIKRNV
jgi:hypothetical protein